MSVCEKIVAPATPGEYELRVTQVGTTDTVTGARAVNGQEVETWTHADLVQNGPRKFTVNRGERHSVKVFATLTSDDSFSVDLEHGGASVASCTLTRDGHGSSSMSLITRSEG